MMYPSSFAALAAAVSLASAQYHVAAPYGQCGGRDQLAKVCAPDFHCHTYNEFYSQCIPGAGSSSSVAMPTAPIATAPSGTAPWAPWGTAPWGTGTAGSSRYPIDSMNATGGPTGTGCKYSITVSKSSTSSYAATSVGAVSISSVATTLQTRAMSTSSVVSTTSSKTMSTSSTPASTSVAATTSSAASSTAAATSASAASTGSYPSTSGTKFVIDGETGYFAGTNAYWIGFLTDNDDVDTVMQHLKESGLKILRVWGFNDVTTTPSSGTVYFQSFAGSTPTINTGADGLERLDYVVKSAEAHGIKLIINFVNNWTDYGGMAAYFTYAGITDNTQWYNNTKAQTQYQAYIQAVVSRYPDSSAIFAWELANEPRCTDCDLSVISTWITNTAKYIKSIDANRMVTIGDEGFGLSTGDDGTYPYETSAGGYDFAANCAIAEIDFCGYHLYPESWSVSPSQSWGNDWITNHGKACTAAGKPCLLEEFGNSDNCTIEASWEATALADAGTGADMFWQYGDTLSTGETSQDGNTVYYGTDLYTCLVTDHVAAIDAA